MAGCFSSTALTVSVGGASSGVFKRWTFSGMISGNRPMVIICGLFTGMPPFLTLLHEPDGTGRAVFTIDFRVTALEALVAQIDTVLHAHKGGFFFRMTGTLRHVNNFPLVYLKRGSYLFTTKPKILPVSA